MDQLSPVYQEGTLAGNPLPRWLVWRTYALLTLFFCEGPERDYASAVNAEAAQYGRLFHAMLDQGVYLAPLQLEAAFLSAAHDDVVMMRSASVF